MNSIIKAALPLTIALLGAGCSADPASSDAGQEEETGHDEEEGAIALTDAQIAAAGIEIVRPIANGAGLLTLPATIEADQQASQVVSAAIGGRVVALNFNLGQPVRRGETLAVIESREAAALKAEVEAANARLALARSNLAREENLFAERVSPEQDVIAARTAAREAEIAARLAGQQLSAAGSGGGGLNRIGMIAPLGGQVIGRSVVLGQTVSADAELFRVADLARLSVTLSLSPEDAGKVRPGSSVDIVAGNRRATARVDFVSPVLDETTRLVTVIARVDNRSGQWRVGEGVTASIRIDESVQASGVLVPADAVQTIEGRPSVFVRTADGFRVVPITLGAPSGDNVVVTSGLTGREQIAGTNSFTLKAELGKGSAEHGH